MDESKVNARMQQVLDLVAGDVSSIRTGRATPAIVESIEISVYGGAQKLKVQELGTITARDTQTIIIDPWDKSIIGEIRKGIEQANVGLFPVVDENIIRINLPPLTTEDREKYIKILGTKLERGKVMIRQIRGDSMKDTREAFEQKQISEDERFGLEKRLQELTDSFIAKIEDIGKRKQEELQGVS